MTMMVVNTLMISSMIAKIEKIKNVVWIGATVNVVEYMQMGQDTLETLSNGEQRLIFPTYGSFLGSMGLLLSKGIIDDIAASDSDEDSSV